MKPHSISTLNGLPPEERQEIYARFIPQALMESFGIPATFIDAQGNPLLDVRGEPGSADVTIELRHQHDAYDPLLYAHLADTVNGQIHVLLYIVNDPEAIRFNVDRMPDGTPTRFGIFQRNLEAEKAAMEAGLAPGQVRAGLRILHHSIDAFEAFVGSLRHDLFFVEPLYYHNAVVFERYGFAYLKGQRFMEQIHAGFQKCHEYYHRMDGSTPFRKPHMMDSIVGRSWGIHDGVIGQAFDRVTMYKFLGKHAGVCTYPDAKWD
jgi:hypothetical protein